MGQTFTAPTSIPYDDTAEAHTGLQDWINTVPNGSGPTDRNTITFPFVGVRYRINTGTVTFTGRKYLDIDGNGCTFEADLEGDGMVPDSKTRSHWRFVESEWVDLHDLTIKGPYTWAAGQQWIATWESQHGIDIQGSRYMKVYDFNVLKVHGDGIYIGRKVGQFPHVMLSAEIEIYGTVLPTWDATSYTPGSVNIDQAGRMGIAFLGCWDVNIHHIAMGKIGRATFDTECNDVNSTVRNVYVTDSVFGERNGGFFWAAVGWPANIGNHHVLRNRLYGAPFSGYAQAGTTGRRNDYVIEDNWCNTPFGSSGAVGEGITDVIGAWTFLRVDRPVLRNNVIPIDSTRNPPHYMMVGVDCCGAISEGNDHVNGGSGYAGQLQTLTTKPNPCPDRPTQPPIPALTGSAIRYGQR